MEHRLKYKIRFIPNSDSRHPPELQSQVWLLVWLGSATGSTEFET